MATPMTAEQMVVALKKEGVDVREPYKNWRTHNRNHKGRWGGVNGIVIHHTAGTNSQALCYNGTSSLPGPLCHAYAPKNGTVVMIGHGRANHAGMFTQNAHDAVVAESKVHPRPSGPETVDGNRHYYGIEVENLGDGKDYYPDKQYEATVKWAAAICRFHGWSADSVIGHKEGTTRKIDPRGPVGSPNGPNFDMDRFRRDVQERLDGKAEKPEPVVSSDTHKVVKGDTLWGISQKYNVTISKIKSLNGLKSDTLEIGQVLKVKEPVKEVPMAKKDAVYKSVWDTDAATPPKGHKTEKNPYWHPMSILRGIYEMVEESSKKIDELNRKIDELDKKLNQ